MRLSIRILFLALLIVLTGPAPLFPQTQLVSTDFFPAEFEFKEIQSIRGEKDLKDPAQLASLRYGPVLAEAGLRHYAERTYTLGEPGSLSIEIMTLVDARGAYSLLTLLANGPVQKGAPGDFNATGKDELLLAAGNRLVHIRTTATGDFSRRIATSIANRIGRREPNAPSLVRHFPKDSCDQASVKYFLGSRAISSFGTLVAGAPLRIPAAVEAAQALCSVQGETGTLTLLSFPTIQLAEEYFNAGAAVERNSGAAAFVYMRQTGPLLGILEGRFPPEVADKVLSSIKFTYSVKWIYDRNNRQGRTIWGVPARVLGTVVRSLFFTGFSVSCPS
jgi:hypothetical protein